MEWLFSDYIEFVQNFLTFLKIPFSEQNQGCNSQTISSITGIILKRGMESCYNIRDSDFVTVRAFIQSRGKKLENIKKIEKIYINTPELFWSIFCGCEQTIQYLLCILTKCSNSKRRVYSIVSPNGLGNV